MAILFGVPLEVLETMLLPIRAIIRFVVALVAGSIGIGCIAQAQVVTTEDILSTDVWKNMEWDHVATSKPWNAPGWKVSHELLTGGAVAKKTAKFMVADATFDATWSEGARSGNHKLGLVGIGKLSDCHSAFDFLASRFGPPTLSDGTWNMSFSPDVPLFGVARDYQWTVGTTRVSATCFGIDTHQRSDVGTLFVSFTSLDETPKLVPIFALSCSIQLDRSGVQSVTPDQRKLVISFWIDIHNQHVLNPAKLLISDPNSFSSDSGSIEFTASHSSGILPDGQSWHFSINRITGEAHADYKLQGSGDAHLGGSCEKVDDFRPKF